MRRPAVSRHAIFAIAIVVGSVGVVGSIASGDLPGNGDSWAIGVVAIGYAALGWTVVGRRPTLRLGWIMLVGGLLAAASSTTTWWSKQAFVGRPGSLPFAAFAAWFATWAAPLPLAFMVVFPLALFPDGTTRSRSWRLFLRVAAGLITSLVFGSAVLAVPVAFQTPFGLVSEHAADRIGTADRAVGLSAMAWLVTFFAAVVAFIHIALVRRHADGENRAQHTTVLIGIAVWLTSHLVTTLVGPLTGQRYRIPEGLGAIFWMAIPAATAVAIVRYRLYDLRILIRRSILVVGAGATLTGIYFAVLVVVAHIIQGSTDVNTASLLAAATVGIVSVFAATTIKARTRSWFGRNTNASSLAARFSDSQNPNDGSELSMQHLAMTVRDELRLGSVELRYERSATVLVGDNDGPTTRQALVNNGRLVGELVVSARRGEALSRRDLHLLDQISRYVTLAAAALTISDELLTTQRSLENAHADERRRLRMDLHDGLGPTLAAMRLKLVAFGRTFSEPGPVNEVAEQVSDAIREVRRIVDGLQPSILEDLGLVPALQILVADLHLTSGIDFSIDAPPEFPQLPTLIAMTAYRTAVESMTNTARHSRAHSCQVKLTIEDQFLYVIVTDDGCGFDPNDRSGVGLLSIRTRVQAIGGVTTFDSYRGRGITIETRIPLGESE